MTLTRRETCRFLRWLELMDSQIAACLAQPGDPECVRMVRVMSEFRANEIQRLSLRLRNRAQSARSAF